ncbi:MAG: DUF6036 family nucleotidyltransferase [Chitinophagaceae bacterium]
MLNFLQTIIQFLHRQNISYMLSGSVALSIYTLPRATRDFDFIVNLRSTDVESFLLTFKEGYYCDTDSVKKAIANQGMFNIIDHASGFKADFMILKNEPFRQTEFERRIKIDFEGIPIYIVSVEDLLLSKLIWIQQLQSPIQTQDIKNLAIVENLDWEYIRTWLNTLKLNTFGLF